MKPPVKRRLKKEYENLLDLKSRVALTPAGEPRIEILPKKIVKTLPPEQYIVTYRCRGIVGIDKDQNPIFADSHQIMIVCGQDFLKDGPELVSLTKSWHPNIEHDIPNKICLNMPDLDQSVLPFDYYVLEIGKLIQYQKYHSKWVDPFPIDAVVAKWVNEYAEPNNIIGPNKPVDTSDLVAPEAFFGDGTSRVDEDYQTDNAGFSIGTITRREPRTTEPSIFSTNPTLENPSQWAEEWDLLELEPPEAPPPPADTDGFKIGTIKKTSENK